MKTLAMLKMEKNFIAHLEKKYPRQPYDVFNCHYLLGRLHEEVIELFDAWNQKDVKKAKLECADISNIVDFIFERLSSGKIE